MAICSVCNDLSPNSNNKDTPLLNLEILVSDLTRSADEGCPSCSVIRDGYESYNSKSEDHSIRISGTVDSVFPGGLLLWGPVGLRFHVLKREICPWQVISPAGLPMEQLTMYDCTEFIQKQYHECVSSHEQCAALSDFGWLAMNQYKPTRLLCVASASRKTPFLCKPANNWEDAHENSSRYVALSHCWGTSQIITTTKATYSERQSGIQWSSLSKTFQDAITITQRLGVEYIWIDSLCIIQDDIDDWAKEASEMAYIYRNSYLTIADTAASDGSGGCFFPRPKIHKIVGSLNNSPYTIYVRRILDHTGFRRSGRSSQRELPLLTRGWTFQEQLLSPRFVHFTAEELVWDCQQGLLCECEQNDGSALKKMLAQAMQDPAKLSAAWRHLIEQYSQRTLTYDRDSLPAVSGLGIQFESTLGTYLAGLWEKDLPFSLLWVSKFGPGRRANSSVEPASSPPSWSWSSIICSQISWQRWTDDLRSDVEILEAKCCPSTSDARGTVSGGHITLRGRLFPLQITYQTELDEQHDNVGYELRHIGCSDAATVCYFQLDVPLSLLVPPVDSGGTVYFLALASKEAANSTHGLLLRGIEPPLPGHDRPKNESFFVRIGAGALSDDADREAYSVKTITVV